jgi:hypothetical protein
MGLPLTVKTTVALPLSLGCVLLVLAEMGLSVPKTGVVGALALATADAVLVADDAESLGVPQEDRSAIRAIAIKGR